MDLDHSSVCDCGDVSSLAADVEEEAEAAAGALVAAGGCCELLLASWFDAGSSLLGSLESAMTMTRASMPLNSVKKGSQGWFDGEEARRSRSKGGIIDNEAARILREKQLSYTAFPPH